MRKYLATLHKRSDAHKKRFALLTSGSITLVIFAFWGLATFGPNALAKQEETKKFKEVGPLESIQASVSESWSEIRNNFGNLQTEMRKIYDGGL